MCSSGKTMTGASRRVTLTEERGHVFFMAPEQQTGTRDRLLVLMIHYGIQLSDDHSISHCNNSSNPFRNLWKRLICFTLPPAFEQTVLCGYISYVASLLLNVLLFMLMDV
ncbi:hypothetical protein MHYP_G00164180 [Metynnis hypsauchen]